MAVQRTLTNTLLALTMVLPFFVGVVPLAAAAAACSDGIDNDGDGKTDYPQDTSCLNGQQSLETDAVQDMIEAYDGPGAPFGKSWQKMSDKLTLYPHITNGEYNASGLVVEAPVTFADPVPTCQTIPIPGPPGSTACVAAVTATLQANTLRPTFDSSTFEDVLGLLLAPPPGIVGTHGSIIMKPGDAIAFEPGTGSAGDLFTPGAPQPSLNAIADLYVQRIAAKFWGTTSANSYFRLTAFVRDANQVCADGVPAAAPPAETVASFRLRSTNEYVDPLAENLLLNGGNQLLVQAPANVFYGEQDLGIIPQRIEAGESLCFLLSFEVDTITAGTAGGGLGVVFMDSRDWPSHINVYSDAARVNLWTEDKVGQVADNFPHADDSVTSDRRINVHGYYFNAWGNEDCIPNTGIDTTQGGVQPMVNADACKVDNLDQNKMRIMVKDKTPTSTTYDQYLCLDQGLGLQCDEISNDYWYGRYVRCCSQKGATYFDTVPILYHDLGFQTQSLPGVLPGTQIGVGRFEYSMVYGAEFPDGVYQIEFLESAENWRATHTVYVGRSGFTFEFAPGELPSDAADLKTSRHVVFLGEPTEYSLRLTNEGANTGTYGVSLETPGVGWKATVTPSTVKLAPGSFQDFTVTVSPPAPNVNEAAKAGWTEVVKVTAVSVEDNSVIDRFTETVLTGTKKQDVELVPHIQTIEVRPGQAAHFPMTVRNLGTIRDSFVITSAGTPKTDLTVATAPSGWLVASNPSYLEVLAASKEDVVMRVEAPSHAKPGDAFILYLRATAVNKDTVFDEVEIPVLVRVIDAFRATTFCDDGKTQFFYDQPQGPAGGNTVTVPEAQPNATPTNVADICTIQGRERAWDRSDDDAEGGDPINCFAGWEDCIETTYQEDELYDNNWLFRIRVDNTGDRTDTYRLSASWTPPPLADDETCDGGGNNDRYNGVPDGWRYFILDAPANTWEGALLDPNDNLRAVEGAATSNANKVRGGLPTVGWYPPDDGPNGGAVGFTRGSATAQGFSGEMHLGELELEAGASQDVYVELHHLAYVCGTTTFEPALNAELRVSLRSTNEDALRDVQYLRVLRTSVVSSGTVIGNDGHVGASRAAVSADLGIGVSTEGATQQQTPIFYKVRAVNTGNEHDKIRVRLASTTEGWQHQFVRYNVVPSAHTADPAGEHVANSGPTPLTSGAPAYMRKCGYAAGVPLGPPAGPVTQLDCVDLGVGDEVIFDVQVTPPSSAQIGDKDTMDFIVESAGVCPTTGATSGCVQQITDFVRIHTRVRGNYSFDAFSIADDREAYTGQIVALPFSIVNEGYENDIYAITIEEGPDMFLPALSSGNLVAVPGGKSFHGFLSAIVPPDLQTSTNCQEEYHFRLKVRSTLAPPAQTGAQSKLIDLFVNPVSFEGQCAPMPFSMKTPEATIRSGGQGDFNVCASMNPSPPEDSGCAPSSADPITAEDILFTVKPDDLPPGYSLVCDVKFDNVYPDETPNAGPPSDCLNATPTSKAAPENDYRLVTPSGLAIGNYHVVAPENELASSRIVVRIKAAPDTSQEPAPPEKVVYHDAILNLASIYGVSLETDEPVQVISAGSGVVVTYDIRVTNTGLSLATVRLCSSTLPAGWKLVFQPISSPIQPPDNLGQANCGDLPVQPGQTEEARVTVEGPLELNAQQTVGDVTTFLISGTVLEDAVHVDHLTLKAVVGKASWDVQVRGDDACDGNVCFLAPQETQAYQVTLRNAPDHDETGTGIRDYAVVEVLMDAAFKDVVRIEWLGGCDPKSVYAVMGPETTCQVGGPDFGCNNCLTKLLSPGQSRQLTLLVTVPDLIQPSVDQASLSFVVRVTSGISPVPVSTQTSLGLWILDYRIRDIDGDGGLCKVLTSQGTDLVPCSGQEYIIDRDREQDGPNGFEEFRENLADPSTSIRSVSAPLAMYLSDEARAAKTKEILQPDGSTVPQLDYVIDAHGCSDQGDGFTDHFIDTDGNGLPDVLWNGHPIQGGHQRLNLTKDVTRDAVVEYFIDSDGDGRLDAFFDLVQGAFGCVRSRFYNQDTILDYFVDLDRDGEADEGEPVLIGAPGGGLKISSIIEKHDMNGDGKLDEVVDTDADSNPDNFVPAGQDASIAIVLRDVTGDGNADWTYAASGTGKPDSYYDPISGESGFIDTRGEFLRSLEKYWYVVALFVFALVLFAILVAVTRK